MEDVVKPKELRSRYFSFILYYDNTQHMELFDFLKNHIDHYHVVYIHHDGEEVLNEEPEIDENDKVVSDEVTHHSKDHIHVLITTETKGRVNGVQRMFGGALSYIKMVFSPVAYIRYMCHDTYNSRGKKRYQISDLRGDEKMIKKAYSSQNAYFIQFAEIVEDVENGATLVDLVSNAVKDKAVNDKSLFLDVLHEYQYLITQMTAESRYYNIYSMLDNKRVIKRSVV